MGVEGRLRVVISISEDARISAKRQVLGSRIRVFDTMPRDLQISVMGLGQDLGLITALGGAMNTSAYVPVSFST
ncbi:hypothetical protein Bca4012_072362 [Brassica carinata]